MEYISCNVICPYYRESSKMVIRCEGGNCVKVRSRKALKKKMLTDCSTFDYGNRCEIAKKLNKRYGVEDSRR